MKASQQYFLMVLLIIQHKVVVTLTYVGEMLLCEQNCPIVLFTTLQKLVLVSESVEKSLSVTIQIKAIEQYFPVMLFIILHKVVLTLMPVDEILECGHSNENSSVALSCGAVC